MYSRQNRNGQGDVSVELPRDYSGNAFSSFSRNQEPMPRARMPFEPRPDREEECREKGEERKCPEPEKEDHECKEECRPEHDDCHSQNSLLSGLSGLKGLFGGNIGLEELLLLGVIFLIFSDNDLRDNELLICLLLILFI